MASSVKDVLEYIAKNIVDDPDAVQVAESLDGDDVTLRLSVAPDDVGKVIGRRGRTARAIRDMVRAAGARTGITASVEIEG